VSYWQFRVYSQDLCFVRPLARGLSSTMPRQPAQQGRDEESVKSIIESVTKNLLTKEDMQGIITTLEERLEALISSKFDEFKKPIESKVVSLEAKIAMYESHMNDLEIKIDNCEQYSRRSCLRIDGISLSQNGKESADESIGKVMEVFSEIDVDISANDIDRAHRVGRKHIKNDGSPSQTMIVKLHTWKARSAIYQARKKLKNKRIYVDLTRRRANLLSLAQTMVRSNPNYDFAFSDINCRLGVKGTCGTFKFFNSKKELLDLLS